MIIVALIVELAAMLIFAFAPSIGWVIAGRVIQGVATGAAQASALGRTVSEGASETFAAVAVGEGSPVLMFHKVPEPKAVKNRLHFDLKTSDFTAESERLLGLGATQLTALADNGGNWVTFADPDGNEFDLIPG